MRPWTHRLSLLLKRWPRMFDITRRLSRNIGYRPPVYKFMKRVAEHFPDLRFIQVGANDGVSHDPIREFVVQHRSWNGVFVEPLPAFFSLLKRNYHYVRHPGLHFLQAAMSDRPNTASIWKIKDQDYSRYPAFVRGIASFDKTHLYKLLPGKTAEVESHLEMVEVQCFTYNLIVEKFQLDRVDLFVLDVEGHEPTILRHVPLTGPFSPKIILFEVEHISSSAQQELIDMFQHSGYYYEKFGGDGVAVVASLKSLLC